MAKMLARNVIVCWLDEVLPEIINQALSPQIHVQWHSIQVFMPFAGDAKFQFLFSISDISRMGEEQIVSMLHQAYCESLRAEDRCAFVSADSILLRCDREAMISLQDQLKSLMVDATSLKETNTRLGAKCGELQTKCDAMLHTGHQEEIATYEAMLGESMTRLNRL